MARVYARRCPVSTGWLTALRGQESNLVFQLMGLAW